MLSNNIEIAHEFTLEEIHYRIRGSCSRMIFYGANTPWWTTNECDLYETKGGHHLPCDPRGGMLFQTDKVDDFLKAAESSPEHYGKYGLRVFLLAYHGCVVAKKENGELWPTCLDNWALYEELIDKNAALQANAALAAAGKPHES